MDNEKKKNKQKNVIKIDKVGMKKRKSIENIDDSNKKNDNNHLKNNVGYHELEAVSGSFYNDDDLKELTDIIEAQQQMINNSSLIQTDEDYLTSVRY